MSSCDVKVPCTFAVWGQRSSSTPLCVRPMQGAGNCFTALCEAIVSWRHVGCEGLHNELIQLMQVGGLNRGASGVVVYCTIFMGRKPAHKRARPDH